MLMQAMLLLRAIAGWICIIGGAVLTISPLPFGFIVVIAGVALLGPRDRGLRTLRNASMPSSTLLRTMRVSGLQRARRHAPVAHPSSPKKPAGSSVIAVF